jgi:hypothetical protein
LSIKALSLALSALQPVHQFVLIIEDPATDFDPRRTDILFGGLKTAKMLAKGAGETLKRAAPVL